jgi:phage terminase large subunit GpA-like protein
MPTLADVRRTALAALRPPERLRLSAWIEREVVLPDGVSAAPGKVRLWPYQVAIADAISDPLVERITMVKAVRLGFSTLLTSAIGHFVALRRAVALVVRATHLRTSPVGHAR